MVKNPFLDLSRTRLQDELLNRLADISFLRKESKIYRDRLSRVRSELQQTQFEIEQIQKALDSQVNDSREVQPAMRKAASA
jgi:hypothetical protein